MREIKFKFYYKDSGKLKADPEHLCLDSSGKLFDLQQGDDRTDEFYICQYTGEIDKNGKEIYESCELDGRYEVVYTAPKYVLKDISTGDIVDFDDKKQYEITRDYTKI